MTSEDENIYATGERRDVWLYNFRCPACNACGDLGVPKPLKQVDCPEKCGAIFVQWYPPCVTMPALRCVNLFAARMKIEADIAHARRRRQGKVNGS